MIAVPPMNRAGVFALLAAVLAFAGCNRDGGTATVAELPAVPVQVGSVEFVSIARTVPVAGTVLPQARATVSAKLMGSVASAEFAVGQQVEAGEVLVTLVAAEINARLAQAEAGLTQAERDYRREASLQEKGASTADLVQSLEERRRVAQAAVAEARSMLAYTEIRAPFTGVVSRKYAYTGDLAAPGTPLFALEGVDRLRLEVQVPESLPALPTGSDVVVAAEEASINGTLAEYSSSADPLSRTRLAKIDLPPAAGLRSGQFARALWPAGDHRALCAPASAVSVFGQMERVFVVSGGRAHLRLIRTSLHEGARVQILAGLDPGEKLVLSPSENLRDGQAVEVQP